MTTAALGDAFASVAGLDGVDPAATAAREAVDGLLWDRRLRDRKPAVARLVALAEARGSAALDGADLPLELLVDGSALDGSPMGNVVASAIAVTDAARAGAALSERAPLQLLARLAALAGHGLEPDDQLGRPRTEDRADDPLRLGSLPPAEEVAPRLADLAARLAAPTSAPAVVVSALLHAELLSLRPFAHGSGIVARAAAGSVLMARGVDPDGIVAPSAGLVALGRPGYVAALRAYQSGTAEGVAEWVVTWCQVVEAAVAETKGFLE